MVRPVDLLLIASLFLGLQGIVHSQEPAKRSSDDSPMKYHQGVASNPGNITLSMPRLTHLEPLFAPPPEPKEGEKVAPDPSRIPENLRLHILDVIREHLARGDSRAAVVISVKPLLVAAYSVDLDCIAMLNFPEWLAREHGLKVGSRLLTVNTFETARHRKENAPDLHFGPKQLHPYTNVFPIIADFITEEKEHVSQRKGLITEAEWERCEAFGREYHEKYPAVARKGSPLWNRVPAAATKPTESK